MSVAPPKPGIYKDVPFETYLEWDAISNSRISQARKSLLHFREQAAIETTKPLRIGQFVHCGVLEPLAIVMRYAVMPPYELDADNKTKGGERSTSKTTKYYETKVAEFESRNQGKTIVGEGDYKTLLAISKALGRSINARKYLGEPGEAEVSIVWIDRETQLTCKARIDWLNSGISDLKTCVDASKFSASIANYGYHRQGAHYTAGYETITSEVKPFRLIAAEKSSPFPVRAAPLREDAMELGAIEVRQALRAIADAYESNQWPGYEDPKSWAMPSWYGDNDAIELVIDGQSISM